MGLGEGTRLTIECGQVCLGKVIGRGGMGVVRQGELNYAAGTRARVTPSHPVA